MNSWDRFLLVVWRCTIGPVLFCLLLLCGIFSFFLGGPRFFSGCWKMAMYGMMADWDSLIWFSRDRDTLSNRYHELERTNFTLLFLWSLLFGLWLRLLFVALMFVAHILLFSDWLAEAMLDLANCARNPAYVRDYWTRNWKMDDDGRLHKRNKVFRPYEISRRSDFSKLDGGNWRELLSIRPQFADKCDWSKLSGRDWPGLLNSQPQFAGKCDWSKLDGGDWADLLYSQPQFADKCDKWDEFSSEDWKYLLEDQPQFADKCDKWDEFSSEDWKYLLRHQPQFKVRRRDE